MLPVAERVAGVCIVRDARDLIPFLCGHYLRIGFGHVAFIDDGSSDGTFEFLCRLARRTQRVSVKRVFEDQCYQRVHVTETANALIAAGYEIIVPFDADEFWCVEAHRLEELLATQSNIAFNGEWVNFVQGRKHLLPRPFYLFVMTFRAPALAEANRTNVTGFLRPFVSYVERKVAFKTNSAVELSLGQHVLLSGPDKFCHRIFEIFHLPIRIPPRDHPCRQGGRGVGREQLRQKRPPRCLWYTSGANARRASAASLDIGRDARSLSFSNVGFMNFTLVAECATGK